MANTFWLINLSSENFKISQERSFDIIGFSKKDNKLTNKIDINDNVIFYVSELRSFVGLARVDSKKYYETKKIWNVGNDDEILPYRVKLSSPKILSERKFVSAYEVSPSLSYIKKWAPEDWYLAFITPVHVISQNDYSIISNDIENNLDKSKLVKKKGKKSKKKRKV
jgi:hypothetical protein|tara:strand:+ start:3515 stop:4015 length:501 start_codon:yes stop_codon:yes gene_type:complete